MWFVFPRTIKWDVYLQKAMICAYQCESGLSSRPILLVEIFKISISPFEYSLEIITAPLHLLKNMKCRYEWAGRRPYCRIYIPPVGYRNISGSHMPCLNQWIVTFECKLEENKCILHVPIHHRAFLTDTYSQKDFLKNDKFSIIKIDIFGHILTIVFI